MLCYNNIGILYADPHLINFGGRKNENGNYDNHLGKLGGYRFGAVA